MRGGGLEAMAGWTYLRALADQRSPSMVLAASYWFFEGPSGMAALTRARRRARSSLTVHVGAIVCVCCCCFVGLVVVGAGGGDCCGDGVELEDSGELGSKAAALVHVTGSGEPLISLTE